MKGIRENLKVQAFLNISSNFQYNMYTWLDSSLTEGLPATQMTGIDYRPIRCRLFLKIDL
jgi:hypothetical protein